MSGVLEEVWEDGPKTGLEIELVSRPELEKEEESRELEVKEESWELENKEESWKFENWDPEKESEKEDVSCAELEVNRLSDCF